MHNTVYELSSRPVPVAERAIGGNLPDWFYERVCDYTENSDAERREATIHSLAKQFGSLCDLQGDKILFSPQMKETYFRLAYTCFKAAAEALAQTDYEVFAGIEAAPAFCMALHGLDDSYEDKRGIYIYSSETGRLETLDNWIRRAELSKPFYIGGTIDYHC